MTVQDVGVTSSASYRSRMDRRRFLLTSLAGGLAVPLAAEAQQAAKIARIGYLLSNPAVNPHLHEAFRQGLRDLGYVEGRNLVIEYRSAEGKLERHPALAAELLPTCISNAINRHSIAGNLHAERDPVRKRGAGAARVGYQRAAGNHWPVAVS
jgi:hypothetical protein